MEMNRRGFLKASGLAGAGVVLAPLIRSLPHEISKKPREVPRTALEYVTEVDHFKDLGIVRVQGWNESGRWVYTHDAQTGKVNFVCFEDYREVSFMKGDFQNRTISQLRKQGLSWSFLDEIYNYKFTNFAPSHRCFGGDCNFLA